MSTRQYEVADADAAVELFHRKGWTDGLPIVPPTPARVERMLAAAQLAADAQLGFYEERRLPIVAEKLAINAVMAGCLPEHFPVVVALVEAMLTPGFMLHVANSSTGSFTLGFIVNGPIRHELGMNAQGNVLGPGNRANASIGRAIRLIQMNVMGSIPGAGHESPPHGRAVLDRSMMGQPAKYSTYHIVEHEEACPQLLPTHVELGFAPSDSTVTLLFIAGYTWFDTHAEQTPEAWIDTTAQYVVGAGKLQANGYGIVLMPPESAQLFANAGWSKADIRAALYERTRRSVAWIKRNGWKVRMHRERLEAVLPEDESTHLAIAQSPAPEDLFVVVCGGPAGSWPYYLYGAGGPARAITRKIRSSRADTQCSSAIENALAPLRALFAADGYELVLREPSAGALTVEILAGPDACPDCLVPKDMMRPQFEAALAAALSSAAPAVHLVYPVD